MGIRLKSLSWCIVPLLSIVSLAAPGSDLRLVDAVKSKDIEAVRSLLKQHVDVNTPQADGATALAWAAHWNDLETADMLIRAGANVNAANDYGVTPLWEACNNANAAMVEKLSKAGANPNATLPATGETALMVCANTGNAEAVKSLLGHGADVSVKEKQKGQTALMWALEEAHPDVARLLMEHGADVRAKSKGGFTPLLFAARVGDIGSALVLLEAGADVNEAMPAPPAPENPGDRAASFAPAPEAVSPGAMTPLLLASASGQEALAIFLLEKGANPNAREQSGATALHYAVLKGITTLNGVVFANYVSHLYRPNMLELVKARSEERRVGKECRL